MKKLVVATLIAICAIATQGATASWTLSQIKTPADSSIAGAGYIGYLFAVSDSVTYAGIQALLDTGDFASVASSSIGNGAANASGLISTKAGTFAASEAVTGFMVVFDVTSASDVASATNYMLTDTVSKTVNAAGSDISLAFGAATTKGYTWTSAAVPEPTSGLLMLLGMAGLALRRRRV